jgi:diguanylate cyclase (GGDEF)-like protein
MRAEHRSPEVSPPGGRSHEPGFIAGTSSFLRRQILLPSVAAALLPFGLLWLSPGRWQTGLLIGAGVLTVVIALLAMCAPWERLPGAAPSALAFAYLVVVALLRAAGGPSGVAPVALLSMFWIGLCGTRRQLWWMLAAITVLFVLPLIAGGPADDPPGSWRAAILFIAISGLVGATLQTLVAHLRDQHLEHDQLFGRLHELAHTDALTGLHNRRAWAIELERALARATRRNEPLSLAVIDLDHFKKINDRQGHAHGDSLLIATARSWSQMLRAEDVLARLGGDEFALLMPACGESEAAGVIARIRARTPKPHSCSVGLATWDGSESAERLTHRADDALYQAKRNGRDQTAAAA